MALLNFPSAVAAPPGRQQPWPTWVKYSLRATAGLLILFVVAIGTAIAVILSGPTEISLVRDRVQSSLQKALGDGYSVEVGKALIDVDPVLGLVLQVDDVAVRDGQTAVVARAPSTRIAIDALALLRLKLEVSTIEIANPEIALVRSPDGEVYLGNKSTVHAATKRRLTKAPSLIAKGADGGFPDLFAALQILDRGIEPSIDTAVKSGFLRFTLVDGTIDVWDAERVRQRRFGDTDLDVSVDPATGKVAANFASSGYGGRWTANFEREVDHANGERSMSAVFSQLTLADIFPALGEDNTRLMMDIPLYGRARIRFDENGGVKEAMARLDLGAGLIRFGESRETVLLDEATIYLRWDIANRVLVVDPSPIYFGQTRGYVSGFIRPDGDPKDRRYQFQLISHGAILAASDSNEAPIRADRLSIGGSADLIAKSIKIDDLTMSTPNGSITAAGSIAYGGEQPTSIFAGTFSPMELSTLKQMWMPFLAPGGRRWVMQHIEAGHLAGGKFSAALPTSVLFARRNEPLAPDQLRLDLRLEDVTFTTYGDIPAIHHASGNIVLAGSTFGLDVEGGEVTVPSGAIVKITAGAFAIDNVFQHAADGDIEIQMNGDAAAIGAIADSKPLQALSRREIVAADLSGTAEVAVSLKMPLIAKLAESDVDWKVTIDAANLASKSRIEGRMFSDGNVSIAVTPEDITIKGKAKIDGVPADVSMTQPISKSGQAAGPGAQYARFVLDDAARKRLGIGLDEILDGTVGATMRNLDDAKGQHYDLDLKRARLVMPGLGWSKGVGVPAQLSFDLKPAPGGFVIEDIVMAGSGFGLSGSARLDENYGLISADIDQMSLRPGDSIAFKLTRTKTGYAIVARGESFDLRGLISHLRSGGNPDETTPDLSINGQLDRMIGFNQEVVSGGKLNLISVNGYATKVSFSGAIDDSKVAISYSDNDDGASLTASGDDAGKLLRFFDVYSRAVGGKLTVSAERAGPTGPLAGSFDIQGFNVVNEPALRRFVSARASADPRGASIDTNSVHFDKLRINFRKTERAIAIDDAVLRGQSIGATFNGRFDFGASKIAINGTYVPAYALNNAVSRVPLIGLVLSGGVGEGLIGMTFRVEGPLDGPRLYVNPLSLVTPGIFRKIFEFH